MTDAPAAHRLTGPSATLPLTPGGLCRALNEAIRRPRRRRRRRARSLAAFTHLALGSLAASVQQQQLQATERYDDWAPPTNHQQPSKDRVGLADAAVGSQHRLPSRRATPCSAWGP